MLALPWLSTAIAVPAEEAMLRGVVHISSWWCSGVKLLDVGTGVARRIHGSADDIHPPRIVQQRRRCRYPAIVAAVSRTYPE